MESEESIDNKYIIIEQKGHGATSNVFLVKDPNTNKVYASKVLKEKSDLFDKEVEILNTLKSINNKFIVNLIDSGTGNIIRANRPTQTKQYLVLEYAPKGELFNYIYCSHKGLGERYSKVIFSKILKGVQACHNAGICHRDLKMQNILVDENLNPKICDFGFATFNTGRLTQPLGTLNYAAPEILLHKPYDGFKADIFSLGVVLLTLTTCKIGFMQATRSDPYYRLIMTKHYGQYWNIVSNQIEDVSEDLKKLYNKMVSFRPQERPTIEEILNDDWMKEIRDLKKEEYDELENKIREEFLKREKDINEELKKKIQVKSEHRTDIDDSRGIGDEKEYFDLSLKPKYAQTGIGMNNYIKITGNLNPAKFMNNLINKIGQKFKNNFIVEESKKALKFKVTFEEEEKEEEEIPKELEEELAKLNLEENENENEGDDLTKKDCVLEVKMYESVNGGHLLRFVKKSGELEDYYKNMQNIISIVQSLL